MHSVSLAASCHSTGYKFSVSIYCSEVGPRLYLFWCHGSVPRELDLQEDTNSMLSNGTTGFFDSIVSAPFLSTMCLC